MSLSLNPFLNLERYFGHFVVLVLLGLSAVYHSAAIAAACVSALFLVLGKDSYDRVMSAREAKNDTLGEAKRLIQDLNGRLVKIEHGIATRGF